MPREYRLKPDKQDDRDKLFAPRAGVSQALPSEVDLAPQMSPIVDQGSLGSCTANAIGSGFREYYIMKANLPLTRLSRLWLYWQERFLEGTVSTDAGAYIRDGMKVLQQMGCAPEVDFPYVESTFRNTPSAQSNARAAQFKIAEYHRVTSYDDLKVALAQEQPVVLGISVYDSFESSTVANTGMVPVPNPSKEKLLGGHAVLAVGYKTFKTGTTTTEYIKVRNSWGTNWGQAGYCWLPKEFFTSYVSDMWTGTADLNPEQMPFDDALHYLCDDIKVLNGFDYWKNIQMKIASGATLTAEDVKYFPLVIQKFAAYDKNRK